MGWADGSFLWCTPHRHPPVQLSRCTADASKNHLLSRIWAWLDGNEPNVVVTDAVPRLPLWFKIDTKHPNDYPGDYVARKFVITEDFYRSSKESISSRSLRDVRNVLRSLYPGLIQLKRPPDDEPYLVEVWL